MVAPAMPVIMQNNKTTISFLAIGINRHFNYPRYFSMAPVGPKGPGAFSDGFFELAAAQSPKDLRLSTNAKVVGCSIGSSPAPAPRSTFNCRTHCCMNSENGGP
jgi:hypothetical protein